MESMLLLLSLAIGIWMAWNIGANDVANSMGTAVGSGALTPRQAALLAGIMNFWGAYFFGRAVVNTIKKGIVTPNVLTNPNVVAYGSLTALMSASIWILSATRRGLPVSTTHSIVGGVLGYGLAYGGLNVVIWERVEEIFLSWIVSPILGAVMAYFLYRGVQKTALVEKKFKRWIPAWSFLAVLLVFLTFCLKVSHSTLIEGLNFGVPLGTLAFLTSHYGIRELKFEEAVKKTFRKLQVLTSSYVALAHGSNDVANAVGPIAAIYAVATTGTLGLKVTVPKWILVLGGAGIALGILTYGHRVMETVGKRITEISSPKGFCAEFSAASIILSASLLGLPISTTHIVVGSVVGTGLTRSIKAINERLLKDIVISWFVTVPVTTLMSALLFKGLLMFSSM